MKNTQKGFVTILLVVLGLIIIGGGIYFYQQKNGSLGGDGLNLWRTSSSTSSQIISSSSTTSKTPKEILKDGQPKDSQPTACTMDARRCPDGSYVGRTGPKCEFVCPATKNPIVGETEKASGIIKEIYSDSGKNYMRIVYVKFNPNWVPGGANGQATDEYTNLNPQIRSLEISASAKFLTGSPAVTPITFSNFKDIFNTSNSYQKLNPWDIEITNGVVTKVTEHFLP